VLIGSEIVVLVISANKNHRSRLKNKYSIWSPEPFRPTENTNEIPLIIISCLKVLHNIPSEKMPFLKTISK
jgi:hypothetical protein